MSYTRIADHCFTCGTTSKKLEEKKSSLKTCGSCQIAKYCSRVCQIMAYEDHHKEMCIDFYKTPRKEAEKLQQKLKSKGIDVNEISGITKTFPRRHELVEYGCPMELSIMGLYEIARFYENREGVQKALDELKIFLGQAQPQFLHVRYWMPIMFLNLGQDQECYDFIKFWFAKPKHGWEDSDRSICKVMGFPFKFKEKISKFSLKDEDRKENFFKSLNISKAEPPFLMDWVFYICLVIIKFNVLKEEKDVLEEQVWEILEYFEKFHSNFTKTFFDLEPGESIAIPKSMKVDFDSKFFAEQLFNKFKYYLMEYLERDPKIKDFIDVILIRLMLKKSGKLQKWKKRSMM